MKWQDKLTRKERSHLLKEAGCRTLADVERSAKKQAEMKQQADSKGLPVGIAEPCWDCLTIARKLELR